MFAKLGDVHIGIGMCKKYAKSQNHKKVKRRQMLWKKLAFPSTFHLFLRCSWSTWAFLLASQRNFAQHLPSPSVTLPALMGAGNGSASLPGWQASEIHFILRNNLEICLANHTESPRYSQITKFLSLLLAVLLWVSAWFRFLSAVYT